MNKIFYMLGVALLPSIAFAGIPYEEEVPCPIGDEIITVTRTMSCSSGQYGRLMSYKAPSSCDFVTRMPVCPTHNLPLYKAFSEDDIQKLQEIVESEPYQANKDQSPWLTAFTIETELNAEATPTEQYWLLMNGYWYDENAKTYGNDDYYGAYQAIVNEAITATSDEERPYYHAIDSYIALQSGDIDRAKAQLETAKELAGENENLNAYIARVEGCMDTPSNDECLPSAPIETVE